MDSQVYLKKDLSDKQISFPGSLNIVARECQMNKLVLLDNLKMNFLDDNWNFCHNTFYF